MSAQPPGHPDFVRPEDIPTVSGPVLEPGQSPRPRTPPSRPGATGGWQPPVSRRPARTPAPHWSVTQAIIWICAFVWLAQMVVPAVDNAVVLTPALGRTEPWRFLTSAFAHSSASWLEGLMHIGFNMYALWILGQVLERFLGRAQFAALYLLSALGGGICFVAMVGPANWNVGIVGASGAVFGLFGALLALGRASGVNMTALLLTLAINAVFMFTMPGIAWQAHIGGFLTGLLCGWLLMRGRRSRRYGRALPWVGLAGVLGVLVGVGALVYGLA